MDDKTLKIVRTICLTIIVVVCVVMATMIVIYKPELIEHMFTGIMFLAILFFMFI